MVVGKRVFSYYQRNGQPHAPGAVGCLSYILAGSTYLMMDFYSITNGTCETGLLPEFSSVSRKKRQGGLGAYEFSNESPK